MYKSVRDRSGKRPIVVTAPKWVAMEKLGKRSEKKNNSQTSILFFISFHSAKTGKKNARYDLRGGKTGPGGGKNNGSTNKGAEKKHTASFPQVLIRGHGRGGKWKNIKKGEKKADIPGGEGFPKKN